MTRKWCGHDPFMMRLVQGSVYYRMVQTAMDPVDAQIREADEQRELKDIVEGEGRVRRCVVKFSMTTDFGEEARGGEDCHYR